MALGKRRGGTRGSSFDLGGRERKKGQVIFWG